MHAQAKALDQTADQLNNPEVFDMSKTCFFSQLAWREYYSKHNFFYRNKI